MPARKSLQVPCLQELCLTFVSSKIDFWCDKKFNVDVNPVATLPNIILNEICTRAMRRDNLRPHHLNTLVHRNTTDLDFINKPDRVIARGIDLIRNVCTNLTSLNLRACTINEYSLAELMKSIPKITYLVLHSTEATDKVLKELGENCPDLRELDLSGTRISDFGIKKLCEDGGKCRLIQKLYLIDTPITGEGVATALRNLPYLRRLGPSNSLTPLEILYRENSNYQLKLEEIYYSSHYNTHVNNFKINAAVTLCKNVKILHLSYLKAEDKSWLPRLADFSQLEELSLIGLGRRTAPFNTCVVPLLRRLGSALMKLGILFFDGIDLWQIGKYCTNLMEINVVVDGFPTVPLTIPRGINTNEMFTELREISIFSCNDRILIETLLSNCSHVRSLEFSSCEALTDQLLRRVCDVNLFLELNTLSISACNNVRVSSLLRCMNYSLNLKRIFCNSHEIQELRDIVRNENFDLEICDVSIKLLL